MTTLTAPATMTRLADRIRDVAETVYAAPAPLAGPGLATKVRRTAYVVGSALAFTLGALLITGLLAALVR
jgi:hypothetical protein